MLTKEFFLLIGSLKTLTNQVHDIFKQLDDLLSRSDKNYTIEYDGETFEFHPPVTQDESIEMKNNRECLIRKILSSTLLSYVQAFPVSMTDEDLINHFEHLLVFASGADPKQLQFEKISIKDAYIVTDSHGNKVQAIPLNMDSEYVKNDLKGDHVEPS